MCVCAEGRKEKVFVVQLCLTLCDTMDYSAPGSSVHGILQARTLEWVAISFSTMIQQMLAIWSLVSLPFLKPAWTTGSSQFWERLPRSPCAYIWHWCFTSFKLHLLEAFLALLWSQIQFCKTAALFFSLRWESLDLTNQLVPPLHSIILPTSYVLNETLCLTVVS